MTDKERFVKLYSIETYTYPKIEAEMNIDRKRVQELYIQCKKEIYEIKLVRDRFNRIRKKDDFRFDDDFGDFYEWYIDQEQGCCYCGIAAEKLGDYFDKKKNKQYEDARQRGKSLELERIVTAPKKENVYSKNNCKLACYICNNAKSDFISAKDFKPIAYGIYSFWKDVVGVNVIFPDDASKIWN